MMREGGYPTPDEDLEDLIELVNKLAMKNNIQGPRRAVCNLIDRATWAEGQVKLLRKALLRDS